MLCWLILGYVVLCCLVCFLFPSLLKCTFSFPICTMLACLSALTMVLSCPIICFIPIPSASPSDYIGVSRLVLRSVIFALVFVFVFVVFVFVAFVFVFVLVVSVSVSCLVLSCLVLSCYLIGHSCRILCFHRSLGSSCRWRVCIQKKKVVIKQNEGRKGGESKISVCRK
jgi:hypothetical protein